jgi:hypothetical protein
MPAHQRFCYLPPADDVWRDRVLEVFEGNFTFDQSWMQTYQGCCVLRNLRSRGGELPPCFPGGGPAAVAWLQRNTRRHVPLRVPIYSDALFQSFLCGSMRVKKAWLRHDNVDRRSGLTVQQFIDEYEVPNRPVVITDVATAWPAVGKWSADYLSKVHGHVTFRCGAVDMVLNDFLTYLDGCHDDRCGGRSFCLPVLVSTPLPSLPLDCIRTPRLNVPPHIAAQHDIHPAAYSASAAVQATVPVRLPLRREVS